MAASSAEEVLWSSDANDVPKSMKSIVRHPSFKSAGPWFNMVKHLVIMIAEIPGCFVLFLNR
jgi:hypothetical protein